MLLIILVFAAYYILLISFISGWTKAITRKTRPETPNEILVSAIIPVRNEAANLEFLLEDMVVQLYRNFEVIVVDDQSQDGTIEKARRFTESFRTRNVNLILMANPGSGKKQALTAGIQIANGSIVVTTDGDCRVGSAWLSDVVKSFQQKEIKMVFGGVRLQYNVSFFSRLQALEFASLIGSGAATWALGFPTMCNGANLAFRKSAFEEVSGYDDNFHIASGDDEFLMLKIVAKYPDGLTFLNSQESVVSTRPSSTLSDFIQQRLRWAGKWRHNSSVPSKVLAVVVLMLQLVFLSSWIMIATGRGGTEMLCLWLIKFVLEGIFLQRVCTFLKVPWHWGAFVVLQFIYPLYVVAMGLLANFFPAIWKGRKTY